MQTTANLQAVQSAVLGYDYTTLSEAGQVEALALMKNLWSLYFQDPNTNVNLPAMITALNTAMTAQTATPPVDNAQ